MLGRLLQGRRPERDERGAVLVLVAMATFFVFLPALAAYAIDLSSEWTHKRHLQLQVDAGALAGGGKFGACLTSSHPTPNKTVQDAASDYSGSDTAQNLNTGYTSAAAGTKNRQNQQFGGGPGTVTVYYNNPTYPGGATDPNPPPTGNPCTTRILDVKATESGLNLFFGLPGLKHANISAQARIGLFPVSSGNGSLPLAVPDVNPSVVFVTLWNLRTGGDVHTYSLTGPTPSGAPNYLNMWTGSASITPPSSGDTEYGMRVGVGNTLGSCGPTDGVGIDGQYACYDQTQTVPVTMIRSYDNTSTTGQTFPVNPPKLRAVNETTNCSGSPFFSDISTTPTCTATVNATVDWPSCGLQHAICQSASVTATDGQGHSVTVPATVGIVNSLALTFPVAYPIADTAGPLEPVTSLTYSWALQANSGFRYNNLPCTGEPAAQNGNRNCSGGPVAFPKGTPPYQAAYSADSDLSVTGPVKVVSIAQGYSIPSDGAAHNLTVTVGLTGNLGALQLPRPNGSVDVMRVTSGNVNRTSIVGCDGANDAAIVAAFQSGCKQAFQIYGPPAGPCSDPAHPYPPTNPNNAPDCVPVKTGSLGQTILNALDNRVGCNTPVVYPPNFDAVPPDPRIVQVMITDLSALLGSGSGAGLVPVTNFASFYMTGWARVAGPNWHMGCNNLNDPIPAGLSAKSGGVAIWGHFIQYVNPNDNGNPGGPLCPPNPGVDPCTPVLVK